MLSLKSLNKFLYIFYFSFYCIISVASYLGFLVLSVLIMRSKDVLFVSNMVSFHKIILLISLFSLITWLLLKLFIIIFEFKVDLNQVYKLMNILKKLFIMSAAGFILIALYYQVGFIIGHPFKKNIIEMNVLALISFIFIIDLARYLAANYSKIANAVLSIMLMAIFVKAFIAVLNGYIPVEFSSVAYLFVPFVFILRIKKLYVTASYIAALAGSIYFVYIIINGGATYNIIPAGEVYKSMFAHGTLLLTGLVSMIRLNFSKNNYLMILVYMLLNIVWALLNRPESIDFRLFIYELIDGEYLKMFINNLNPIIYMVYYLTISSFLFWSIKTFHNLNEKWNLKYS